MATLIIPGHDRDALVTVLFPGLARDLGETNPLVWTVQCAACGRDYRHIEGVHDGFCDDCEDAAIEAAIADLAADAASEDHLGFVDVRAELDALAVDEWRSAERDQAPRECCNIIVDSQPCPGCPIAIAAAA